MLIAAALLVCIATVPIAGGRLGHLADLELRTAGPCGGVGAPAHDRLRDPALAGGPAVDGPHGVLRLRGLVPVGEPPRAGPDDHRAGRSSNFVAIAVNGGVMPAAAPRSPWPASRTSRASSRARCPSATRSSRSWETSSPCRPPGRSTTSSASATSASSWAPSCWCTSSAIRRCSGRARATSGARAQRRLRARLGRPGGLEPRRLDVHAGGRHHAGGRGRAGARRRACCSRRSRRPQLPALSAVSWWIVSPRKVVMIG